MNYFNEPYVMEKCFPTLFPRGKKGIAHNRDNRVFDFDFIQHCFFYYDKRFRTHPLFNFWIFNCY